jgi:beta-glucanase (GH16 family)
MLRRLRSTLLIAGSTLLAACSSAAPVPPGVVQLPTSTGQPPSWALAWSDEFDGAAGAAVDPSKWVADTGGHGWGNKEREYYTAGTENAALDGAGHLVITARTEPSTTARRCWYGTCQFASARLKTQGRLEPTYGRIEGRMRIPRGQGIWPAFWMLGNDIGTVGWPQSGEIDVMENIGKEPAMVHGTMHGPGYSGGNGISGSTTLPSGAFADDFHVYAVEWTPGLVRWLVDDKEYHRVTPANLPSGAMWVFDHPFFLLINVAVGGAWPGDPDATSTYPQQMVVDYVRVYRR